MHVSTLAFTLPLVNTALAAATPKDAKACINCPEDPTANVPAKRDINPDMNFDVVGCDDVPDDCTDVTGSPITGTETCLYITIGNKDNQCLLGQMDDDDDFVASAYYLPPPVSSLRRSEILTTQDINPDMDYDVVTCDDIPEDCTDATETPITGDEACLYVRIGNNDDQCLVGKTDDDDSTAAVHALKALVPSLRHLENTTKRQTMPTITTVNCDDVPGDCAEVSLENPYTSDPDATCLYMHDIFNRDPNLCTIARLDNSASLRLLSRCDVPQDQA